jgi:DNA-directed RNA polymerase subunit H (RpoH/RPB5)
MKRQHHLDHVNIFAARGYTNIGVPEKAGKFHQVVATYNNPRNAVTENITFIWPPFLETKMSSPLLKGDLIGMLAGRSGPKEHFIFFANSCSAPAVAFLRSKGIYFEIISSLDTFIPKHVVYIAPEYTLLDEKTVVELEKVIGDRNKFARMIASVDAMARYLDFRVGDVVRIKRWSPSGPSIYFRLLVPK